MPRSGKNVQPSQDALIIAHPESGEMMPRDFTTEGTVDLVAHRLHQLNALSLFGAINQREMFYTYQRDVAEERYKDRADEVLRGSRANRDAMQDEARDEYYRSLGVFTVVETANQFPDFDLDRYLADAKRSWSIFQARYRGERHSNERNRLMKALRAGIMVQQSEIDRQEEIRPYISEADQKRDVTSDGREYPLLSSRERMEAVRDDSRAGFLPKNNREKFKTFTYLDYMDNPKYPLGINDQFIEIFYHQQKNDKVEGQEKLTEAQRAVVSVTHELGDHWRDAVISLIDLTQLERDLDGANPSLYLTEDVPADHPGIARLVRYRDLARWRDTGELPEGIPDPLRVVEDRRPHDDETKNKTVSDLYTAENRSPKMEAYLADQAGQLTIRQARKLLKEALADERAREAFLGDRMEELAVLPENAGAALPMRWIARRVITEVQKEAHALQQAA